jgi:signal transduction histidine kinase
MLSKFFYDAFHPKDYEETKKVAFKIFENNEPFREFINKNMDKNGNIVWLSTSGIPLFDEKGDLSGYRGLSLDITGQKLVAEKLEKANIGLKKLSQEKSEFVSMVAHELRLPITGIIGFAQTLHNLELSQENKKKYLTIIETEGKRLSKLIEDLLDISKIESGYVEIKYSLIDISQLIKEILDFIKVTKEISIQTKIPADLSEITADRDKLRQVLNNLISNAVKFNKPGGEIIVSAKEKNKEIEISVKDEGPGIEKGEQDKIFNKFYISKNSEIRKKRGSGLGLTIIKRIVEMHKGKIWVESEVGKGSVFSFSIPKKTEKYSN